MLGKDIPFLRSVMPQEFSAVLVKGRSNYVSLRRLDVAIKRQDLLFQRPEEFDQLAALRFWANRTNDGSRSDLDFRPLPSVWEAVQSEDGNCLGRECPRHAECFYLHGPAADADGATCWSSTTRCSSPTWRCGAMASACCPDYEVAIIDEAHTFEAVAGEHLGLQLSSVGVDYALARLYNERSGKGVLSAHPDELDEAIGQAQKDPRRGRGFLRPCADWFRDQPAGFNGRLRRPTGWSETLAEELRRLAAAIGRGAERIEKPEEQIELTAAEERCRTLADEVARLAPTVGRGRRLLGRGRAEDAGRGSAWPRRRWTSGPPSAACCSPRSPPAS